MKVKALLDLFDLCLMNLRSSLTEKFNKETREAAFAQVAGIRHTLKQIHDSTSLSDLLSLDPQAKHLRPVTTRFLRNNNKKFIMMQNDPFAKEKRAVRTMRGQNLSLMSELNDLRSDRLSLKQQLSDAHCQLKEEQRTQQQQRKKSLLLPTRPEEEEEAAEGPPQQHMLPDVAARVSFCKS